MSHSSFQPATAFNGTEDNAGLSGAEAEATVNETAHDNATDFAFGVFSTGVDHFSLPFLPSLDNAGPLSHGACSSTMSVPLQTTAFESNPVRLSWVSSKFSQGDTVVDPFSMDELWFAPSEGERDRSLIMSADCNNPAFRTDSHVSLLHTTELTKLAASESWERLCIKNDSESAYGKLGAIKDYILEFYSAGVRSGMERALFHIDRRLLTVARQVQELYARPIVPRVDAAVQCRGTEVRFADAVTTRSVGVSCFRSCKIASTQTKKMHPGMSR